MRMLKDGVYHSIDLVGENKSLTYMTLRLWTNSNCHFYKLIKISKIVISSCHVESGVKERERKDLKQKWEIKLDW